MAAPPSIKPPKATVSLSYPSTPATTAFQPQLESLRGVAAVAVLITHVAFQTGYDPTTVTGAIMMRFDFFLAVFFALSGYLLWRRQLATRAGIVRYARRRFWRILPAYWVCVIVTFALLPDAYRVDGTTIIYTLLLGQLYLPHGLAPGLTHLWSMCVEVGFYVLLPFLAVMLRPVTQPKWRVVILVAISIASLGWAFIPVVAQSPAPGVPNRQIYPIGFFPWFAVGLVAAEIHGMRAQSTVRQFRGGVWWHGLLWHGLWWAIAIAVMWLAGQEFLGPVGLTHPTPWEFVVRVVAGAVMCCCVFLPYAWGSRYSVLNHTVMRFLGRISYSFFLWHIPVMSVVFTATGIAPFSGHFGLIAVLSFVISVVVGWCMHVMVEVPFMQRG